jgi:hypothetical protein
MAALILEVLAGVRTPTEAASALSVTANRYYQLEDRALEGLVAACEPRPRGPGVSQDKEIRRLKRQVKGLQDDVNRHQALARAAQRAVGLSPPAPADTSSRGKRRRKRKPVVRALKLAHALQSGTATTSSEENAAMA